MSAFEQTLIDILRVDHAGECGAIRIYEAQRRVARARAPDLVPFLGATLADERQHRDTFEELLRSHGAVPCRVLALWGAGGSLLGSLTGLLGSRAILVCTEAVERTVHKHLIDQVRWIGSRDYPVSDAIAAIQVEELAHLHYARDHNRQPRTAWLHLLDRVVAISTEALIWISTYGRSASMTRAIANV